MRKDLQGHLSLEVELMVTVIQSKSIAVEQFTEQYGSNNRYELIDGEGFDLEPTGPHKTLFLTAPSERDRPAPASFYATC